MTDHAFPDEALMAYADGELDPETAERLEAALAGDAALARRLAVFTGTRDALARAAGARSAEPVPEALMARVRATLDDARAADGDDGDDGDGVLPFARPAVAPPARQAGHGWRPMALAASLALAVGLGAGWMLRPDGGGGHSALHLALLDAPGIEAALSRLASGERQALDAGEVALIASFRNADGELCREYEFDEPGGATVVSVACHSGAGWETRLAVVTAPRDGTGYAPASSLETLDSYLAATGVETVLSGPEEAAALAALAR